VKKKKSKNVTPIGKLKNSLRRLHMQCPHKNKAKQRSKIDSATFLCEVDGCKNAYYEGSSEKNFLKLCEKYAGEYNIEKGKIELDHKIPVVDVKKGFGSWDDYIRALWVDENGYTNMCRVHHAEKTAMEAAQRAESGSLKRKK
jgi:hypothetical protein